MVAGSQGLPGLVSGAIGCALSSCSSIKVLEAFRRPWAEIKSYPDILGRGYVENNNLVVVPRRQPKGHDEPSSVQALDRFG